MPTISMTDCPCCGGETTCEGNCTWMWVGGSWAPIGNTCAATPIGCTCHVPDTPGTFEFETRVLGCYVP